MNLFTHLITSVRRLVSSRRDFEAEADQLADRLEMRVWELVSQRAGSLTRHEARGYLRARTTLLLADAVQQEKLSAQTQQLVSSLVLAELTRRLQPRLVELPVQQPLRAAA